MKYLLYCLVVIHLAACGFTPVYNTSEHSNVAAELSSITISPIINREGQFVRNALIDRINHAGYTTEPKYRLVVSPIRERLIKIGIDTDDEASRAQLRENTTIRLIDLETNKAVLTRTVRSVTSYNILAGQFTTYINEQDAREQALRDLSEEIITELELYFKQAQQ